jgi:hypothetical protein
MMLAAILLLAGCATGPAPPLLSPLAQVGKYGYAETKVASGRYEVSYLGPPRRTSRFAEGRRGDELAARTQAYDFAVWRAAQIALQENYAGFRVGQTHSNIDTYVEDYADPFFDPFWGPYWYRRDAFAYPFYPYTRTTYAYLQARVTIDVTLLHNPGPGDYLARDAITQLRRTYPGAEGLPKPPPTS